MRKNLAKLLIVAVAMMTMASTVSAADTATQTVSTSVGTAISITAANVTIPAITAGGSEQSGTGNLTVNTNSATGFHIDAENNDGTATSLLDHATAGDDITDKTAWNSSTQNGATWSGTGTGFRVMQSGTYASAYDSSDWGTNDTSANALYAGMPASGASNTEIARSTVAEDNTARTIVMEFKVATPASQKSGNYDGEVLYTATAN